MRISCPGMIFCIRYPMLMERNEDPRSRELTDKMGIETREYPTAPLTCKQAGRIN